MYGGKKSWREYKKIIGIAFDLVSDSKVDVLTRRQVTVYPKEKVVKKYWMYINKKAITAGVMALNILE